MKMADGFPTKILIVDDREAVRESLASRVSMESSLFTVRTAQSGEEALALLEHEWFDVVLCDRVLRQGMDGVDVTREIASRHKGIRVMVFTGKDEDENTKLDVLKAGAYSYLSKPIHYDELLHGIAAINSIRRTEYLGESFKTLAGIAYNLQQTFDADLLARRIVEGARSLGWHRARLYLIDEVRRTLVGKAESGMPPGSFEGYEIPLGASPIISAIFAEDRPIILDAEEIKERFGEKSLEPWFTKIELAGISWFDCPLVAGNKRIGTLAVDHHNEPGRRYTQEDLEIMGVFSGLAAQALNNSRLYQEQTRLYQEQALANASLSSILREAPDGVVMTDLHGVIKLTSPSVKRILGVPPARMIGTPAQEFYTDKDGNPDAGREIARQIMEEVKAQGTISNRRVFLFDQEKRPLPISMSISLLHDEKRNVIGTLGFLKESGVLEAQNRRYRDLLEGFGYGTLLLSEAGLIEFCNRKAERLLYRRRDSTLGRKFLDMISEVQRDEFQAKFDEVLSQGVEVGLDLDLLRPDATPVPAKATLSPFRSEDAGKGVAVALYGAHEISLVIQSGRLMVLGQMVAKVAHEINNPLNNILPAVRDLRSSLEKRGYLEERSRGYLEIVERNGGRIQSIVRQLREFARPREFRREPVSVNQVVHESLAFLETLFRDRNIHLELSLDPRIPNILGEPTRLQQVLINLLINAEEAMEGQPEAKKISIETRLEPPDRVILQVSDTGRGVPEDLREALFDPFFTTKAPSKGTGLGLAISREIIELHEGKIELVSSSPTRGACFRIELKRTEEKP